MEVFHIERDGIGLQAIGATTELADFHGLRNDLTRTGFSEDAARDRARAVLRYLGLQEVRQLATAGLLAPRTDDTITQVPINLGSAEARRLAFDQAMPVLPVDRPIDAFDLGDVEDDD